MPLHFDRDPSPCLYHDGLVIVAPSDTPAIFRARCRHRQNCLDQRRARRRACICWASSGRSLIVSGNRLWRRSTSASGKTRLVWPESEHAGIRGMGRGVVAGNEIFWPTRNEIYVDRRPSPARARARPSASAPSATAAPTSPPPNGRLIVAGYDKLMAFGPPAAPKPQRTSPNEPTPAPPAANDIARTTDILNPEP